jgi:hypothetical protein
MMILSDERKDDQNGIPVIDLQITPYGPTPFGNGSTIIVLVTTIVTQVGQIGLLTVGLLKSNALTPGRPINGRYLTRGRQPVEMDIRGRTRPGPSREVGKRRVN